MSHSDTGTLAATVEALGKIMLEMQRRKLLARPYVSPRERQLLQANSLTDEQIGDLASDGFVIGTTELARLAHPGAQVTSCNPTDEP